MEGAGRTTADRGAVITDSVGQQEVAIGVRNRHLLRRGTVFCQITAREPGQQSFRGGGETIGQPEHVSQPSRDSGIAGEIRGAKFARQALLNQKRALTIRIGTHQFYTALRVVPGVDHHKLQFIVEKGFTSLLPGGSTHYPTSNGER